MRRIRENLRGGIIFDEFPEIEEGRFPGYTPCLLHAVGDDHDREVFFQLEDEVFDSRGRDRIQRRARLIHQEDFRFIDDGPRDAQPLLLAAGQTKRGIVQPVLHLVPQGRSAKTELDGLIQLEAVSDPTDAQRINDILVDGFGERIRFLENHADPFT